MTNLASILKTISNLKNIATIFKKKILIPNLDVLTAYNTHMLYIW